MLEVTTIIAPVKKQTTARTSCGSGVWRRVLPRPQIVPETCLAPSTAVRSPCFPSESEAKTKDGAIAALKDRSQPGLGITGAFV